MSEPVNFSFPSQPEYAQSEKPQPDRLQPDTAQPDDVAALRARLGISANPNSGANQPAGDQAQEDLIGRSPTQRWRMGWRPILAGAIALLLVAGVLAVRIQGRGPSEVVALSEFEMQTTAGAEPADTPSVVDEEDAPEDAAGAEPLSSQLVLVHVAGAVEHPGVVELPASSRVFEALDKAGGALDTADLTQVNLARTIADGEQLVVPLEGETVSAQGDSEPGGHGQTSDPIDINAATAADFETLPGVGPALAERIIDFRESNGGFQSIDQLADVSGIGPSTMGQIRELVRV